MAMFIKQTKRREDETGLADTSDKRSARFDQKGPRLLVSLRRDESNLNDWTVYSEEISSDAAGQ